MTSRSEQLRELATACEKAEGPDRELDALILSAAGLVERYRNEFGWGPVRTGHVPHGSVVDPCIPFNRISSPKFTASIDAALTLVPEGHWWDCGQAAGLSGASVWPENSDRQDSLVAATPVLALCAAALNARSQSTQEGAEQ